MDEDLFVTFSVIGLTGEVLKFEGETSLPLSELRKMLSLILMGLPVVEILETIEKPPTNFGTSSVKVDPIDTTMLGDSWVSYLPTDAPTKRRPPRPKTKLVCHRCGRPYKGMSIRQKYCHKKDCEATAAASFVAGAVGHRHSGNGRTYKNASV